MPRLFFMANSVNISNNPLRASRITAYRGEFGRVRGKACCCCCCLASNSLYKSRLIEQQSAFTQQRLSVEQKKKLFCSALHIWKIQERNWDFSRWKAHSHVSRWIHFLLKDFKNEKSKVQSKWSLFWHLFIHLQIYQRLGKRQSSLHNNKKSSHVDRRHFILYKVLGNCLFFSPQKKHSNPRENVT